MCGCLAHSLNIGFSALFSKGRYHNCIPLSASSHTSNPFYFRNFGSARNGFFFAAARIQSPFFPLSLLSLMHSESRSLEYPCPFKDPETQKQSIYIYPGASTGFHAFSAGIYSIKHFPRSTLLRNTSPSLKRSESHAFFDETCSCKTLLPKVFKHETNHLSGTGKISQYSPSPVYSGYTVSTTPSEKRRIRSLYLLRSADTTDCPTIPGSPSRSH